MVWRVLLIALLCLGAMNAMAAPLRLVYPPGQTPGDKRYEYYWELLAAVLATNAGKYGPYVITSANESMSASRAAREVATPNGLVNIIVRTTSPELEGQLRPIRVPLDKGLTGYRLFLIRSDTQARLTGVRSLNDLARFGIGQDRTWVDVRILRAAGLHVVEGEGYAGLFRMLDVGRFDLFSRGVNEIADELAVQRKVLPNLAIERELMLYYPLPRYFFVPRTPEGEKVARRIEHGLERLIRSGQFERRYQDYKRLVLRDLPLHGRRVLRIPNPTLSPETPLGVAGWWDDLAVELRARP
ncbi:hypothetical protein [Chitinimonas prasina]|nr:hypothetical protein [Chitinimonas prasina]